MALSAVGLFLIVFAISMLNGHRILDEPLLVLKIAAPVCAFLLTLFAFSYFLGKTLRSTREDAIAFSLSTIPKNNAVSPALAFSAFGSDTALVNAIAGPLVQLPILLLVINVLALWLRRR